MHLSFAEAVTTVSALSAAYLAELLIFVALGLI
jgi:hypothetical protein